MKQITNLFIIIGIVALVAFVTGCSSTSANQKTEDLLSVVGFKATPATTPQQRAHLQTLPPHKFTMVVRDGKTYYVYPDQSHHVLYVGQDAQYREYQKVRQQNQMAEEEVRAAEMNSENAWNESGAFDVAPVLLR